MEEKEGDQRRKQKEKIAKEKEEQSEFDADSKDAVHALSISHSNGGYSVTPVLKTTLCRMTHLGTSY